MAYIFEFDICNSKFKYSRGYQCLTTRGRDIYYGVAENYVFLVPILGLRMSFPVNFRSISGEISTFFLEIFIAFKDSSLDFRAIVLS